MYGIYSSMAGMTNSIFIVAMIVLTIKFWSSSNLIIRVLLLFGVSLFTIIQPLLVYLRAKRQVSILPKDMYIGFNKIGVHIETKTKTSVIKWKEIKGIHKMKTMIILYTSDKEGYILTDKILGSGKSKFYQYLINRTKK
ncbi:MAG TPA: YcxB family protein [Tissierellales bacterium]|nr:YcxB family protein [Tissierellales bacterium]